MNNIGNTLSGSKTTEVDIVLKERGINYGDFSGHARIVQDLKRVMDGTPNWETLSDDKKQALEMIVMKIGRILNGDPDYVDSWRDIEGYARLITSSIDGGM